ncbi:MAG TPA: class I SAM-dependent methyltransferase [Glaciibacter sp.]|nr:class I SAM-dependent methyltransferase [Glaciibacter sp.]
MDAPLPRARFSLRERAVDAVEIMDDPASDPELLRRTYEQFRHVNSLVSGTWTTYRRDIRPHLSHTRPKTLLDIGSGGGDVARALARWASRDGGLLLDVTAIDPDPRAHDFATSLPRMPGLSFRRAFSADLVAEGARFDFVMSNHVLHHLSAQELGGLLFDSERLVRDGGRVLHGDIERNAIAYVGFGLVTWPFFRDSFIRADGLTSIRRSYTAAELQAAVPPPWRVDREFPSRLVLRFDAPVTGSSPSSTAVSSTGSSSSVSSSALPTPGQPFGPGAAGPEAGITPDSDSSGATDA